MKALIWIGCIFSLAICIALIKNCGVILGGIPSAVLFGGMYWLANTLCKKVDAKKNKNEGDKTDEA